MKFEIPKLMLISLVVLFAFSVSINALNLGSVFEKEAPVPSGTAISETGEGDYFRTHLFADFEEKYGKGWIINWNELTNTPNFIAGKNIPVDKFTILPFDEYNIETISREFVYQNQELFGVQENDLILLDMKENKKLWNIFFQQYYKDVPVYNAFVNLRFTEDSKLIHLSSDVFRGINIETTPLVTEWSAFETVKSHPDNYIGNHKLVLSKLNIYFPKNSLDGKLTWKIIVKENIDPSPIWTYFIDAKNGKILNFFSDAHPATYSGTINTIIYPQTVFDPEDIVSLRDLYVDIQGASQLVTNENGFFTANILGSDVRQVSLDMEGPFAYTDNDQGADAHIDSTLNPDTPKTLGWSIANSLDSERNVFYHIVQGHERLKEIEPSFDLMDYSLRAIVNSVNWQQWCNKPSRTCNACSATNYLVFFTGALDGCIDFGTMPDVVYHEYAHTITRKQYGGSATRYLSEAFSDYWANTNLNMPQIGVGWRGPGTLIRNSENSYIWPGGSDCLSQNFGSDIYCKANIIAGALWGMRNNLIDTYSYSAGVDKSDDLYHFAKHDRPSDIDEFLIDLLEKDDDNNDLTDGTPNYDDICGAFGNKGISCPTGSTSSCGEIYEDITLDSDVFSSGTCFTFMVSDATLDCANHKIVGIGNEYGIYAKDKTNIKVKNCRIENFMHGIYLDNVDNSEFGKFSSLRIDDSGWNAMTIEHSSGNDIFNTIITGGDTGIEFYDSDNNLISNANINSINYFDVYSSFDSDNTIKSSSFNRNKIKFSDSASSLKLQWMLGARVMYSNGQPVDGATVTITNKKGTQIFSGSTNPDGYIPQQTVTEYIHNGDGSKDYYTAHTIIVQKGADYDERTEYVERDETVTLVFGVPESSCGIIKEDTILKNDVYTTGDCFHLEAEGITLNCDGYKIIYQGDGYGVYMRDYYDDVDEIWKRGHNNIVKNCIIENCNTGIFSQHNPHAIGQKILSNEIKNCVNVGIYANRLDYAEISGNKITNCDLGADIRYLTNSEIYDNTFTQGSTGMECLDCDYNEFYENEFSYNTGFDSSSGLKLSSGSGNEILNNDFIGNKQGFLVDGATTAIAGNDFIDNFYGMHLSYGYTDIYNNKFIGNTEAGLYLEGGSVNGEIFENHYDGQGQTKYLILLEGGQNNVIRNEELGSSQICEIYALYDTHNELLDSSFHKEKLCYDATTADLKIKWSVDVRVVDGTGYPLGSAFVTITDDKNNIVFQDYTETNGYIPTQKLIEY
ncbi:MAG: right-handed parallel beta-helix repeat-containing protein, partial [Bacteroidota bacterium]